MEKLKRGRVFSCIQYIHGIRLRAYRVGGQGFKSYDEQFRLSLYGPPSKKNPPKRKKKTLQIVGNTVILNLFCNFGCISAI